jgi:hypothetical protein
MIFTNRLEVCPFTYKTVTSCDIPIPNEKIIRDRMGIFVFRRKTPRREKIYPPEASQLVTVSSVKGIYPFKMR